MTQVKSMISMTSTTNNHPPPTKRIIHSLNSSPIQPTKTTVPIEGPQPPVEPPFLLQSTLALGSLYARLKAVELQNQQQQHQQQKAKKKQSLSTGSVGSGIILDCSGALQRLHYQLPRVASSGSISPENNKEINNNNNNNNNLECEQCHNRGYFTDRDSCRFTLCTALPNVNEGSTSTVKPCCHHQNLVLFERYRIIGRLGSGNFSDTFAANDQWWPNRRVAIKILRQDVGEVGQDEHVILESLAAGRSVSDGHDIWNHPSFGGIVNNLMPEYYGWFQIDGHIALIQEALDPIKHETFNLDNFRSKIDLLACLRRLTFNLCLTTAWLHGCHESLHADIKWENILWSPQHCQFKLIDYGNLVPFENIPQYYDQWELQSLLYRAPEVILGMEVDGKADLWSIGCVIGEAVLGRPLFLPMEASHPALLAQIQLVLGDFRELTGSMHFPDRLHASHQLYKSEIVDSDLETSFDPLLNRNERAIALGQILQIGDIHFVDFLAGILDPVAKTRMSALEALKHPFLLSLQPSLPLLFTQQASVPARK